MGITTIYEYIPEKASVITVFLYIVTIISSITIQYGDTSTVVLAFVLCASPCLCASSHFPAGLLCFHVSVG